MLSRMLVLLALLAGRNAAAQTPLGPTEPAGQFVSVNGHRLWYRITGSGEPILLIAGGPGGSHSYFWPYFDRLASSAQVIYFDAFGRGKSDRAKNPSEYGLEGDVEDVEGLRRALGLGPITVYGHSYGGIVAQAYALKYPASVRRIVLADTFHSGEMWQVGNNGTANRALEDQYPAVYAQLQALRAQGIRSCDTTYQRIQSAMYVSMLYFYDPSNVPTALADTGGMNMDVYCQIAGSDADVQLGGDLATFDPRPRLASLRMPVLVLIGRFDRVSLPRYAMQFSAFIPSATVIVFERSGHLPYMEEPVRHDSVLRAFLKP